MSRASETPAEVMKPRLTLLICTLALLLLGLVMVYSVSSVSAVSDGLQPWSEITSQVVCLVVGLVLAVILWKFVPYRVWGGPLTWAIWFLSVVLILLTSVKGQSELGATRWLSLGPFTVQPSELFKIAMVLMAARILHDAREGLSPRSVLVQIILFLVMPAGFMFAAQSDLGTTLICAVGILAVAWLGEVPLRWFVVVGVLGGAFVLFAIVGSDYRSGRMVFLDPWNDGADGYGDGYNIIRSFYAFAEGGILGVGLGNSHEKYQYLFGSESDFIFSIIGEELGLIGALVVIALFLAILFAGLRVAKMAPDDLGAMIAGGCVIMLVFQAFLNMGSAMGALPTTGKPLPFISSGGSSLISSLFIVGLILSVSQAEGEESPIYNERRENLRIVRAEGAPLPQRPLRRYGSPYRSPSSNASAFTVYRFDDTYSPIEMPRRIRR